MRYGILADVHANLAALDAVLERLRFCGVDAIVVAGDLVGYGPRPNECVDRLREVGALCVAGNHDLYATRRREPRSLAGAGRVALEWTRRQLGDDVRAHLEALPLRCEIGGLVIAHGSVEDPEEYVTMPAAAERQLHATGRPVVVGHTHRQWLHSSEGSIRPEGPLSLPRPAAIHLMNPGSVGQSRQAEPSPQARFAILDTITDRIDFEAIAYDTGATERALEAAGLPRSGMHLVPGRRRSGPVQRVRRGLRRGVAALRHP